MSQLANKAIKHVLERIVKDPRVAYYFCDNTESFALLTAARAEALNEDVETMRSLIKSVMKFEEPKCKECKELPDNVLWANHMCEQIYDQIETAKYRAYVVHGHEKELLLAEIRGLELAHSILRGEGC